MALSESCKIKKKFISLHLMFGQRYLKELIKLIFKVIFDPKRQIEENMKRTYPSFWRRMCSS